MWSHKAIDLLLYISVTTEVVQRVRELLESRVLELLDGTINKYAGY